MYNKLIIKTNYVINITFTKVELFAIHCSINQSVGFLQIKKIIIITDSLHAAKSIFDSLMHLYQIHFATIFYKLREFFILSNHLESFAENMIMILLLLNRECFFRHQISKEEIS